MHQKLFRFEWQKAEILVSELKCDPYEEEISEDRLDQIENELSNVKSQINNKITNLKSIKNTVVSRL